MDEVVTVDQRGAVGSIVVKPRAERDPGFGVDIQGGGENVEFALCQQSIPPLPRRLVTFCSDVISGSG
eukprot:1796456-Prymnesium_polylepis.1